MRNKVMNKILGFALSLATVVCLLAVPAFGATYNLVAEKATVTMPDANNIPMWGFRDTADSNHAAGDWKIPTISAVAGETLIINLSNNLQAPGLVESVSVIIPGQKATEANALVPEFFTDTQGRRRVNSFTHSAASLGLDSYEWNNLKAGTYLIQSGTHPAVQMQMGLYAILKVDQAPNLAYLGVPYQNEVTLLFSEIDAALHAAVADGTYGTPAAMTSTIDYSPSYFLINGQPHTAATPAFSAGPPGESLLLRFLNAGLKNRVPVLQGAYLTLIAEDGYVSPYASEQYSVVLPPGKTFDALIPTTTAGLLSIYDRALALGSADGVNNGMFVQLNVEILSISAVALTETAVGDGSFDYTALGSGGSGTYEYEFWLYDPAIGWAQAQAYSTLDSLNWTPPAAAGTYWLAVNARSQGSTVAVTDVLFHEVVAPVITAVTLTETAVGDGSIDYTATASPVSGTYEYEFWLYDPASGWMQAQAYSAIDSLNWTPPAAPGTYWIAVDARAQGSSVVMTDILTYVVEPAAITAVTLTEAAVGDGSLNYTAAASPASGTYEYEFWLYDPASGWTQAQAYSTLDSLNWTPPATPGTYWIVVDARAQGSSVVMTDILTYVVEPPAITAVTLTEAAVGDGSFNYTATASPASGTYEYEFWLNDPASGWTQVQAYLPNATWNWTPPTAAGTYTIAVNARSQGSSVKVVDVVTHVVP